MNKQVTRDESFDFIKGFLIFLVVWGHVIQYFYNGNFLESSIYIWIYSFHMPLFILISGYFALGTINKSTKECIHTRMQRLLVPAIIWTIIRFIAIEQYNISEKGLIQSIYSSFRGIWFLYCLFALYVTANVIWKSRYKYYWATALLVIGYSTYQYQPVDILKHFQLIRQWPLFVIGIIYAEHKSSLSVNYKYIILLISIIAISYCYWLYNAVFEHKYLFSEQTYLCRGIILIIASILFYAILKFAYSKISSFHIAKIFSTLGKYTLGIYMTNSLIIFALVNYLPKTGEWNGLLLIYSILITVISYTITFLIKKNKVLKKYLLGE